MWLLESRSQIMTHRRYTPQTFKTLIHYVFASSQTFKTAVSIRGVNAVIFDDESVLFVNLKTFGKHFANIEWVWELRIGALLLGRVWIVNSSTRIPFKLSVVMSYKRQLSIKYFYVPLCHCRWRATAASKPSKGVGDISTLLSVMAIVQWRRWRWTPGRRCWYSSTPSRYVRLYATCCTVHLWWKSHWFEFFYRKASPCVTTLSPAAETHGISTAIKKECCSTVIIQGSMDPRLPTSNRDAVKYLFPRKEEIELDRLVKFNRFTLKHSPGKFNSKG